MIHNPAPGRTLREWVCKPLLQAAVAARLAWVSSFRMTVITSPGPKRRALPTSAEPAPGRRALTGRQGQHLVPVVGGARQYDAGDQAGRDDQQDLLPPGLGLPALAQHLPPAGRLVGGAARRTRICPSRSTAEHEGTRRRWQQRTSVRTKKVPA